MSLTLVSSDQQSFSVERAVLKQSGTIETLIVGLNLDDAEADAPVMPIPLPNVTGKILAKVIEWIRQHKDDPVADDTADDVNNEIIIPAWDKTFLDAFDQTTLLELTVAANYLDIKTLLNLTCKTIANTFKGKTGEQIRTDWGVPNLFTPEEEAAIKKENEWCE